MIKLIDCKDSLSRGTILRCPGAWPYEAIVDFMVVDFPTGKAEFSLVVASGYKAGHTFARFPAESLAAPGEVAGISPEWLRTHWKQWGYFPSPLERVWVVHRSPPLTFDDGVLQDPEHPSMTETQQFLAVEQREIDDIKVPGYLEKDDDNTFSFHPMPWQLYFCSKQNILEVSYDLSDVDIRLSDVQKIGCRFDMDEDDFFATSSVLGYLFLPLHGSFPSTVRLASIERHDRDLVLRLLADGCFYKMNIAITWHGLGFTMVRDADVALAST